MINRPWTFLYACGVETYRSSYFYAMLCSRKVITVYGVLIPGKNSLRYSRRLLLHLDYAYRRFILPPRSTPPQSTPHHAISIIIIPSLSLPRQSGQCRLMYLPGMQLTTWLIGLGPDICILLASSSTIPCYSTYEVRPIHQTLLIGSGELLRFLPRYLPTVRIRIFNFHMLQEINKTLPQITMSYTSNIACHPGRSSVPCSG